MILGITENGEHSLNVQAVELRTGVCAETLRSWERRYGWPRPRRLTNGYRVYSEEDVALILAVKREMDRGAAAAAAWQRVLTPRPRCCADPAARSPMLLTNRLVANLLAFDADGAASTLAEAHALYPLDRVLVDVIQAALVCIGERWQAGEVAVAQEHFAAHLLRDTLTQMARAYRARKGGRTVVVGAAPGEWHDIGALCISLLLRQGGHQVVYLGANVPLEGIGKVVALARADMLLLSASRAEPALALADIPAQLDTITPRPLFVFGGQAFSRHPDLAERIDGIFIPGDAAAAATRLDTLLSHAEG
jgi:methanogenic corrinoid protein MtbC1